MIRQSSAVPPPIEPLWKPKRGQITEDGSISWLNCGKFVAHHETIKRGGQIVGRMISKTLAKRAANALNRHQPNSEGV
jgi:hypothetical protein